MCEEKYIDFELVFLDGDYVVEGCVDLETIDDDEPDFEYRLQPWIMSYQSRFPYNPFHENKRWEYEYEEFEKMAEFFHENFEEISQLLWDFQDGYWEREFSYCTLRINPESSTYYFVGEEFEMAVDGNFEENGEPQIGDTVYLTTSEIAYDNQRGNFCRESDLTDSKNVQVRIFEVDSTEYVQGKCTNGGCYGYAKAEILRIL